MGSKCDLDLGRHTPTRYEAALLWFLAHIRSRLETVALQNLQQQSFDAYLPLYKRLKKSGACMEAIFEPMLPRYLFFKNSRQAQHMTLIRLTPRVMQVVSFGHEIATLRSHTPHAIRQPVHKRNATNVTELIPLHRHHTLRFSNSAINGFEGLVKSFSGRRVAVLLELMGCQQVISVDHQQQQVA